MTKFNQGKLTELPQVGEKVRYLGGDVNITNHDILNEFFEVGGEYVIDEVRSDAISLILYGEPLAIIDVDDDGTYGINSAEFGFFELVE